MKNFVFVFFLIYSADTFLAPFDCSSLNDIIWKSDKFDASFDAGYFKCTYKAKVSFKSQNDRLTASIEFKKYEGICEDEILLELKGYCGDTIDPDRFRLGDNKGTHLNGSWVGTEYLLVQGGVPLRNTLIAYMQVFLVPSHR